MNLLSKIAKNKNVLKPVIYGVRGLELNDEEKVFFKKSGPIGFILFARNIQDKIQLKKLTNSLKELMEDEILILVDQEGGRVARLNQPNWKIYPNGNFFHEIYKKDENQALNAIYKNFQEIAFDLKEVGINVNCAPILDLKFEETHDIIGDRAYGDNVEQVSNLGQKVCEALLENEIYPIIKHIPGHGRATCDSHLELPKVNSSFLELLKNDFAVFKNFTDQKFAMTAHIVYSAIDEKNPATTSKKMINLIRDEIGFKNILMSDDLSMKALSGNFKERAANTLKAGCDLILHCNSEMKEMQEIDLALSQISDDLRNKLND